MCQQLLKASHGMNVEDFLDILKFILERRKLALKDQSFNIFESRNFGPNHLLYDIDQIKTTAEYLSSKLKHEKYTIQCQKIISSCESAICFV